MRLMLAGSCCPCCLFVFLFWVPFPVLLWFPSLLLFSLQLLGSTTAPTLFLAALLLPMDHAQGRAFHHHLARAIMHLNHLAGLLPFFEPSIEWEDSMPSSHFRLDRQTSRGLHTFVPLPPSLLPPTMVSHGGVPSHMVVNPEPNLRPTTTHPPHYMDGDHTSTTPVEVRNPVLRTDTAIDPNPSASPGTELPRGTTRPTIPVPVRSKQRASSTHNPRRNKNRRQLKPESRWLRDVAALAHFPSHQRHLLEASTQMTPIVTQHQELLPLMITRTQTSTTAAVQHQTPPPPLHQAPPRSH